MNYIINKKQVRSAIQKGPRITYPLVYKKYDKVW